MRTVRVHFQLPIIPARIIRSVHIRRIPLVRFPPFRLVFSRLRHCKHISIVVSDIAFQFRHIRQYSVHHLAGHAVTRHPKRHLRVLVDGLHRLRLLCRTRSRNPVPIRFVLQRYAHRERAFNRPVESIPVDIYFSSAVTYGLCAASGRHGTVVFYQLGSAVQDIIRLLPRSLVAESILTSKRCARTRSVFPLIRICPKSNTRRFRTAYRIRNFRNTVIAPSRTYFRMNAVFSERQCKQSARRSCKFRFPE